MRVRLLTRHAWCALFALCTSAVSAQLTGISTEIVQIHTSGALSGQVTYRVYADLTSPTDYVSAVYGSGTNPLEISTVTDFYQDTFGAALATSINTSFLAFAPTLAFDSWLTIGAAPGDAGAANGVNSIGMGAAMAAFEAGNDLVVNSGAGGSWFLIPGNALGVAGADNRVLLAQLTSDGVISLDLNVQVFVAGQQADDQIADEAAELAFAPGCSDPLACNFNAAAISNDGSCTYPASTCIDCAGNPAGDANGNGICDASEITGCMDASACNFDGAANVPGSCTYPLPYRNCDQDCLADADSDNVCDAEEIFGCTDPAEANYNPAATEEDGSCNTVVGCMDPLGSNYNPAANSNGWCNINPAVYCGAGTVWHAATSKCIPDGSAGYGGYGSACFGDFNNDGARGIPDLLIWLPVFENACGEDE